LGDIRTWHEDSLLIAKLGALAPDWGSQSKHERVL
jgi:hypothetical protein